MKYFALILTLIFVGCVSRPQPESKDLISDLISGGEFTAAIHAIDSILNNDTVSEAKQYKLMFTKDSLQRVSIDFNKTREDVVKWIKKEHGFTPSEEQLEEWESLKALEFKIIDGEKRYFRNAAPNIFRVNAEARALTEIAPKTDTPRDSLLIDALNNMKPAEQEGKFLLPKKRMHVVYTLTVKANAVPAGELLRVWLPYPRADVSRQSDITFIRASQPDFIFSEDTTAHTSVYMEKKARRNRSTVFEIEYEFSSQGEYFDLAKLDPQPYKANSADYKLYTSERPPHIQFTDKLKSLTDSVTRNSLTPIENLRAIYGFIAANYPWASALEYSTIPNIPDYVIDNKKGDCGQVALLLITMLRYKGIPARWQSGWMVHPGEVNLHDWAEVYIEGVGWMPIDISFARGGELDHPIGREFFMTGIDSYRLYVNSDYSGKFYPEKKYPRSETVDFQRGEVESEHWNLYFDKWNYKMKVTYIDEDSDK